MKTQRLPKTRSTAITVSALLGALTALAPLAHATDGTWATLNSGNWIDGANWTGGNAGIAGGIDSIANFNTVIAGVRVITVDAGRTVGTINMQSSQPWQLTGGTLVLATSTGTPIINTTGNDSHFISSEIQGTQGFTKNGSGGLILRSATNSYTGVTTLNAGKLFVRTGASLGATGAGNETVVIASTSTAQLQFDASSGAINSAENIVLRRTAAGAANSLFNTHANGTTLTGTLTLERGGASNAAHTFGVQVGAGTLTLAGSVTGQLASGGTQGASANSNVLSFRATVASANANVTGVISDGTIGANGLSVVTASDALGILRLGGANTYTGGTSHAKGALLVNNTTGSGTGFGSVSVASGAVFGGTGTLAPTGANTVTFASGSIVAVGDQTSAGAAISAGKTLAVDLSGTTGGVTFASGATINLDLAVGAPTVAESLAFSGLVSGQNDVHFNGNLVNFSITGGILADGLYTLAAFDSANTYDGQLVLGSGLAGYNASLIHNPNSIQLQIGTGAIPEPSSFAVLGGLAALAFGAVSRRRR